MVIRQRDIHHRADFDLASNRHGAVLNFVHTQNARLRRVQDRRGHQRSINAAIGDGEGTARQFIELQRAITRTLAEFPNALFDFGKAQSVGIPQHRHHQARRPAHRNAHMHEILIDNLIAINFGIHRRKFLQRGNACLHEEGHEAKLHAMPLFEGIPIL